MADTTAEISTKTEMSGQTPEKQRKISKVSEILLESLQGPKAQMRPWRPWDINQVATRIVEASDEIVPPGHPSDEWLCRRDRDAFDAGYQAGIDFIAEGAHGE